MRLTRPICGLFLASALGALAGCGGTSSVSGTVAPGGAKPVPGETWSIVLTADGKSYSAEAGSDGKFTIPGVAPGDYKVEVTHSLPATAKGQPIPQTATYPETWKVPGGPYTLDVSKLKK